MENYNEIFSYDDMMSGGNLIIMVGVPGCGKTTKANLIKDNRRYGKPYLIVSTDKIREELSGNRQDQSRNKEVFDLVYERILEFLDKRFNVIYDATNCNPIHRSRMIKKARPYANKIACVQLKTPLAQCFRNNYDRVYSVPEEIVEKMYFKLKHNPPTINEGFDIIVAV